MKTIQNIGKQIQPSVKQVAAIGSMFNEGRDYDPPRVF
jgi:hypothetical protein